MGLGDSFLLLDERNTFAESLVNRLAAVGQQVMRSPYHHHLAPDGDITLAAFGRLRWSKLTASERHQLDLARVFSPIHFGKNFTNGWGVSSPLLEGFLVP